jgi:hypothetical protein
VYLLKLLSQPATRLTQQLHLISLQKHDEAANSQFLCWSAPAYYERVS